MTIEDPHDRARAILWCLSDLDPDMPVREALGYLKLVEAELDRRAKEAELEAVRAARVDPPGLDTAELVRIYMGIPQLARLAKFGQTKKVAEAISDSEACSMPTAMKVAESLVAVHATLVPGASATGRIRPPAPF